MPFDPEQISAVIFDMDGVLIDSEILSKKTSIEVAKELGFTMGEDVLGSIIGLTGQGVEQVIRQGMGETFPYEEFDAMWRQKMGASMMAHVPVKPGVRELLALLDVLEVPAAVATSSNFEAANHHLSRADLITHFATIISGDDVDNGKPHPEPFLLAAQRLEVEPEFCLAIEDSHNGVRSAHGAGMQTIMVPDLLAPTEEMRSLSIAIMENLHQVREHFEDN